MRIEGKEEEDGDVEERKKWRRMGLKREGEEEEDWVRREGEEEEDWMRIEGEEEVDRMRREGEEEEDGDVEEREKKRIVGM